MEKVGFDRRPLFDQITCDLCARFSRSPCRWIRACLYAGALLWCVLVTCRTVGCSSRPGECLRSHVGPILTDLLAELRQSSQRPTHPRASSLLYCRVPSE